MRNQGERILIEAVPRYSGKYSILMNIENGSLPSVGKIDCKVGEKKALSVVSTGTKVFDQFGAGVSIGSINIEETFPKRMLRCALLLNPGSEAQVRLRMVKLSEL